MKDFFTEEIEGKTATLTLPEKSPKKDFYSEEIENDFYSKEVKPSIFPKEKTIPEIKQAPPKTISEKIKSFFREPPVAGIAKAQNIYAISKTTGIPLQDVRKNYEGLVRQEKITGIRPDIGKKEYMALVTAPLVATGLVTHPIGAIAGLTTFGILNKLIPTEKFIPSDINDDVKTAIELADFIGKAAITGAVFKKAPLAIEKFTKNKFTEFNLPKTIKLTAGQVKDIYQTGKLTTPEQQSLFGSLGLTNKQTKIALEKGIDINIPAEKLVKLTDKPYWQKIKSVFGIKPYEKVTTTLAQKPTVALAGLLPEPVVTPIAPKVTPTIPSIAPTIPQIPPKSPIVVPITPQIPIVAPKAITPPITPPEVTAPPIKPEVALGKKELLKQLDEAIEKAPLTLERVTTEFPKTISFKIDGGVDIVNTKDALTFFRKRVKGVSTEIFGKPSIKPTGIPKVKDFYKEEVETPAAFAGTIAEEIPAITAPSAEIVKRSQIISNLGEKLNVPIRKGGFGGAEVATRGALGIYKPKPDIIRWKSGGVGTISHEIGHFLDDNFRDLHELIIASRPEIGPLDYNPMKQRANEGFSEFLRYWTTQPEIALKKAPQFHTQFETWLNNNPDVRTVLDNARQNYQAWLKMPSVDKVKSQISFEPEAQVQGIKHTVDSLYSKVVDELAPIQRYVDLAKKQGIKILDEENPYVLARLLKGNTGKANHFLNYKTFNTKLEITGKGLREVLEPIKNNLEDFSTYLVARRVPELKERGKEIGISKQDALNTILDLDKKYPQFKGVTEELYAYQDRLLQYAFENGLISPMGLIKMKALNKNYVPFYRVFEELQRKGYMGDTLANLSSPIKRMTYKGSEREIIDPIESIMKNTYAIINTADRNAVARGMIILSKQNKELGRLFEKIATPLSKVATVDLGKEVNKILAEEGNELPEDDINMIIDIFRPSFFTPKDNTLTVMQGGKKEFYYVDSEIYKAMLGLEKEEMSMLIKVLSYPARWLRAGATTLSPEFLARNPLRDQFSAYVYSKTGYVPVVDLARGMFNLFGKSDLYWEWVRGGGEHATIVSVDREYMRQNLKELFQKNWKDAINPLKWMQTLSEFGEQGTRLGEFVKGRIKGMGIKESAFTARNVTLDFAKMGSKIKTANKITAFMNANIQGLFRPAQAFREKPVATWFKILTGITLPSIILYLMNRDDERYKELPRWQRDLFWIIRVPAKTPSGEILLRIPKPFELGIIFGTVPERILEYIDTKDPTAFDKLRDTIVEGAYLNPKQWIPTALVPILENMTNWSFFRDKKLETMGMERLLPEERYTAFTSETAKKLGRLLGYSPVKIENLVSGYTGAGGQLTLDLLDFLITGGKRKLPISPETTPVIRGFIAREPVGSFSESVNKFYENYEKITQIYNTMQEANKRGDKEKFNELRKHYPKVNPIINGMIVRESKRLSEGRKEINKILDDEDISQEIKLQKIRNISMRMTEIAKKVNNRLKE